VSSSTVEDNPRPPRRWTYVRFWGLALRLATDGTIRFYAWMFALTAICLVGVNAWAHQVADGMVLTNMTDHVSWGLYIANFTFTVGLAAGGVMMIIPAYLYRDKDTHDVVIVGEILAIAAIVMSLAFVTVDIGRPDRLWHMVPGLGRFHWPVSMLTWDVIVLTGYLLINMHVVGYVLYARFRGGYPARRWYVPFVLISIVWAISIHTVTAFLYAGLGGRPFWNSALLAPRFLASAFITGPAFIIVTLFILKRIGQLRVPQGAIKTLFRVMQVTVLINLFMLMSELFTHLYAGGSHAAATEYLFIGLHGHMGLVPWTWLAILMNVAAAILLLMPSTLQIPRRLIVACVLAFVGVWIEKGMGLIVPGFVPSTLHEVVEYTPSLTEWKVTAGVWALGLMIFTVSLKVAIPILTGRARMPGAPTDAGAPPPSTERGGDAHAG